MIKLEQKIKTQLKNNIIIWWKENIGDLPAHRDILYYIVKSLKHEVIHCKIYDKFSKKNQIKIVVEMEFKGNVSETGRGYTFSCDFKCLGSYPIIYNLPKYYPIYIFIEFVHTIFDIIDGIVRIKLHKIIYCLKGFLKTLFELKFKKYWG